ncbi:MAG: ABC transporter ATP-binding protein [Mycetocola sp.]
MTSTVVQARGLSKSYGSLTALDNVDLTITENKIYGLLGRNGAGKTTIMQLLTGQIFPDAGELQVFGAAPAENGDVLSQLCFIAESQKYADGFHPKHVFEAAPWFFPNWDQDFADQLIAEFRLPVNRQIKKLSRGQLSSVGIIVGLASRAPVTFFDEPYLGLDAVARTIFYDRLLEDYAAHPRTVILSTHLIDEVSRLLEHVIVIDEGRVLIDSDADDLRDAASTVVGAAGAIDRFSQGRTVLGRENIGGLASITVEGALSPQDRAEAAESGLEVTPVSLQQLVVHLTGGASVATEGSN